MQYQNEFRSPSTAARRGAVTTLIMRFSGGTIRTEQQAQRIMIIGALLASVVTLFFLFSGGNAKRPQSGAIPVGQVVPQ